MQQEVKNGVNGIMFLNSMLSMDIYSWLSMLDCKKAGIYNPAGSEFQGSNLLDTLAVKSVNL
jgi:hypothetical protein